MAIAVSIYGLVDPRSNELRYVGKTSSDPLARVRTHLCRTSLKPKRHISRWLTGLLADGHKPEVFVIELVDEAEWQDAERFWIAYFRSLGARLVNITDGGEGVSGYRFSPERREEMRLRYTGRVFDEEWRRRISEAKKGKPACPITAAAEAKRAESFRRTVAARQRLVCKRGHPLAGDNVLASGASKICRECKRAWSRESYLRNRPPPKPRTTKPKVEPPGYANGERHPHSKLSWENVDDIRRRVAGGETRREVGAIFGVALTTVDQIVQGRCWKPEHRPVQGHRPPEVSA